ncbi:MAG TPA: cobalt-precorrin-6A reductase [Acidimicrobiia bacterium]|nr:cobalt-precorrin-6A reductase [Acidimicrobiia bacterium]
MVRVLILGGTTEASDLARLLDVRPDTDVVTSFAGRTAAPRAVAGRTRVGGFGGATGLAEYLRAEAVDVVLDATHPFARQMRWHAADATDATGIARLRVERPPWRADNSADWTVVPDLDAAAQAVAGPGRVFLTIGRTELGAFARCDRTWFLVRSIEPPDPLPLRRAVVVLGRGPFTVERERALMAEHTIDTLVTKNSGGTAAAAKLTAAHALGVAVVMVERPPNPPGPLVETADEALGWLTQSG